MAHYTGNDIPHLAEVGEGLYDCWCIAECCKDPNAEKDSASCVCPECWCQLPSEVVYEQLGVLNDPMDSSIEDYG